MINHDKGWLLLNEYATVLKLQHVDEVEFDVIDIDVHDEITVTQIGCLTGHYSDLTLDVEKLRKGLDHLAIVLDDGPSSYSIVWRETGNEYDNAVIAMLHHTVNAAGYDVTIFEK